MEPFTMIAIGLAIKGLLTTNGGKEIVEGVKDLFSTTSSSSVSSSSVFFENNDISNKFILCLGKLSAQGSVTDGESFLKKCICNNSYKRIFHEGMYTRKLNKTLLQDLNKAINNCAQSLYNKRLIKKDCVNQFCEFLSTYGLQAKGRDFLIEAGEILKCQDIVNNFLQEVNDNDVIPPINYFFRCLGYITKSDGVVTQEEAKYIKNLFKAARIDKTEQDELNIAFIEGKKSSKSFYQLVVDLGKSIQLYEQNLSENQDKLRETYITILCEIASIDGVTKEKAQYLEQAGNILGCKDIVERCLTGNNTNNVQPCDDKLQKYYKILGCSPMVSDEVIKITYREKQELFSCDSLQKLDVPKSVLKDMEKEMQEITKAYNEICKKRNIK